MCMEVLPSIKKDNITQSDIYEEYTKGYIKREVEKLSQNKTEIVKFFSELSKNFENDY